MNQSMRTLACLAVAAAVAAAQNDFNLDKTQAGTLGGALGLAVAGAPANALLLVMPSFTGGPTPLAVIDPTDTRSLQVGTDLAANWWTLFTNGSGGAGITIGMPNTPSFHGVVFHWQTLTVPGAQHVVDKIGNDVVTVTGSPTVPFVLASALAASRAFAAAVPDATTNAGHGDLLVAGGGAGTLTAATGLASTEQWDFRHLRVVPGPSMTQARALHLAVPLQDGRVFVCGGADATGIVLASCEIYTPATHAFTPAANMSTPRILHAACRLADGRVLVAGGTSSLVDVTTAISSVLDSAEIYDPAANTWTPAPALGGKRLGPALTLLNTNRVLCSGGVQVGFFLGIPISAVSTTAAQLYNPTTNTWSAAASMRAGRAAHHYNQVTLQNGRVLMTGGVLVPNLLGAANATPIADAEYYDPAANTWTAVNMPTARSLHSATLLPNGDVVVCGGTQGTLTTPVPIANVDRFVTATGTWTSLPALSGPRASHVATLQPDGLLVLLGGQGAVATLSTIETLHF